MPTEPGRPRDPDVDARIVAAASAILDEDGPDAVTVTSVAKRAGVGRPTVYRRYQDSADLLRGVLFTELEASLEPYRQGLVDLDPQGPLLDDLMLMARPSYAFYAENPERSKVLLSVSVLAEPKWQARWDAMTTEVAGIAVSIIQAAIARGELPPDTDVFLAVQSYLMTFLAVLISALTGIYGPGPDGWLVALRRLLDQHYDGLLLRGRLHAAGIAVPDADRDED